MLIKKHSWKKYLLCTDSYLFATQHIRRFYGVGFQFTASLSAAIQQVRVHDIVVVRLQGRPEIVFAGEMGRIALKAARALTLIAAPGIAPDITFRIAFLLQS